jgi:hypothetical protein
VSRENVFTLTVAIAIANGLFSPDLVVVMALAPVWYPEWLPTTPGILYMLSSLILSTTTLLAGGVPAALAERLAPSLSAGTGTLWIWFVCVLAFSARALSRMFELVLG